MQDEKDQIITTNCWLNQVQMLTTDQLAPRLEFERHVLCPNLRDSSVVDRSFCNVKFYCVPLDSVCLQSAVCAVALLSVYSSASLYVTRTMFRRIYYSITVFHRPVTKYGEKIGRDHPSGVDKCGWGMTKLCESQGMFIRYGLLILRLAGGQIYERRCCERFSRF